MGIARRKAGQLVDCPKCHREIRVPPSDQTEPPSKADLLEDSRFDRWLEAPAAKANVARRASDKTSEQPSSDVPWTSAEPSQVFYAASPDLLGKIQRLRGWLAFVFIAAAFLLGLLAGRYLFPSRARPPSAGDQRVEPASHPLAEAAAAEPALPAGIRIRGRVLFQREGKKLPDEGSSFVLLPAENKPAEKFAFLGLRPEDHALKHQPGVDQVRRLGGVFGILDAEGRFSIPVPKPAKYYVLILSKNVARNPKQPLFPHEDSILQQYFADVAGLVGEKEFLLLDSSPAPGKPSVIEHTY